MKKIKSQRFYDGITIISIIILIAIAGFIGRQQAESDLAPFLQEAMPSAKIIESSKGNYIAWADAAKTDFGGFLAIGSGEGYGGQMTLAVAADSLGLVTNMTIVSHKETGTFLRRVLSRDFLKQFHGKSFGDPFDLNDDIQGISGATYTCRAITQSIRRASRGIAASNLGFIVPEEPAPPVRFGLAEILLIILFLLGFLTRWLKLPYIKVIRWISMLTGLIFLGFIFNKPLTLTIINKFILGYWPQWQYDLFWYIMVVGILFVYTVSNKNPYCEWFCPFGAAQECLGMIGGAKNRVPDRFNRYLKWIPRVLAMGVILTAMITQNPSQASYEVFGAFFRLIGSNFLFGLLAVILVVSLFVRRPWCRYLCPLRPFSDFIRLIRRWIFGFTRSKAA